MFQTDADILTLEDLGRRWPGAMLPQLQNLANRGDLIVYDGLAFHRLPDGRTRCTLGEISRPVLEYWFDDFYRVDILHEQTHSSAVVMAADVLRIEEAHPLFLCPLVPEEELSAVLPETVPNVKDALMGAIEMLPAGNAEVVADLSRGTHLGPETADREKELEYLRAELDFTYSDLDVTAKQRDAARQELEDLKLRVKALEEELSEARTAAAHTNGIMARIASWKREGHSLGWMKGQLLKAGFSYPAADALLYPRDGLTAGAVKAWRIENAWDPVERPDGIPTKNDAALLAFRWPKF